MSAGAWEALRGPHLSAYERMRVWHESVASDSDAALVFDAADVGEPNLGHIAASASLQASLLRAFSEAGGHLEPAALTSIEITESCVNVATTRGTLAARLVIGADGAHSALRAAAGLTASASAYGQTAIVATVGTERTHDALNLVLVDGAEHRARAGRGGAGSRRPARGGEPAARRGLTYDRPSRAA